MPSAVGAGLPAIERSLSQASPHAAHLPSRPFAPLCQNTPAKASPSKTRSSNAHRAIPAHTPAYSSINIIYRIPLVDKIYTHLKAGWRFLSACLISKK
jgi:hypothetical protein